MTKYDYIAIAILIALMVWAAADKFPRQVWPPPVYQCVQYFNRYTEDAINLCDVLLTNHIQAIHQSKIDPNV